MRRRAIVLAALLTWPGLVEAQGLGAGAFNAQRRIYLQGGVLEQTGLLAGGSAVLGLGPLRVGVSGWMGTLKGDGGATNPDAKARTTSAFARVLVAPGVQVGGQYEVRRFESEAMVAVWSLMGANARLEPGLGVPGLQGLIDVSVLPASSVSEGPKLKMAVQTTVGVSFGLPRSPLSVRIAYRFERFDIEATGSSPERYEQFRGLVVEAGLRLGR